MRNYDIEVGPPSSCFLQTMAFSDYICDDYDRYPILTVDSKSKSMRRIVNSHIFNLNYVEKFSEIESNTVVKYYTRFTLLHLCDLDIKLLVSYLFISDASLGGKPYMVGYETNGHTIVRFLALRIDEYSPSFLKIMGYVFDKVSSEYKVEFVEDVERFYEGIPRRYDYRTMFSSHRYYDVEDTAQTLNEYFGDEFQDASIDQSTGMISFALESE